jgi:hypothetical protein
MKGVIVMITKIKNYIMSVKYRHYADMAEYYLDKAINLGINEHFDEADECFDRACMYLKKQYHMTMRLLRLG